MEREEFYKLVQEAREVDLFDYLKSNGFHFKTHGNKHYLKEQPCVCIYPETNSWYDFYHKVGRVNNSIDFLTEMIGYSFNEAVYELTGKDISLLTTVSSAEEKISNYKHYTKINPIKNVKKDLIMPEQDSNMKQLFAYFCKTRKIPSEIVEEFVKAGLLYQSKNIFTSNINGTPYTSKVSNAVFVHKNDKGEAIGGEIQGLNSFKRYKGIVGGTGDSAFIFSPFSQNGKPKVAYIFESAIDLMSFYKFCNRDKIKEQNAMFVSMGGLKATVPKKIEADGIRIFSCVDNDDAGRKFEAENNFKRPDGVIRELDSKGFKDWNELLVFKSQNPNANLLENNNQQINENEKTNNFQRRK